MDFQIDNVKFDFINEEEKGLDFLSTNSTMSFSTNNFEMQIEKMTPSLAFETTGVGSGTNENDHTKLINRDA